MDITPAVPAGRQVVESYGGGRFRVSGTSFDGSVLVLPEQTVAWDVTRLEDLSPEHLRPVLDLASGIEILLLGCGPKTRPVASELRDALREQGISLEPMDTGAACRTYNVLLAEGRRVAAALIAIE